MRILVLPNLSKLIDVTYDSCFVVPWQWARLMPQHYWYFSVPKNAVTEGFELPNVHFIRCEHFVDYHTQQVMVDPALYFNFNGVSGKYPIDLISTSRVPAAITLKRMFIYSRSCHIPVVVFTSKAMGVGVTHDIDSEIERRLRSVTYTECQSTFNTARERQIGIDAAKQFLTASELAKVSANTHNLPCGIPHDEIEQCVEGVVKDDIFTMYYGGRLAANKKWPEVLDVYSQLLKIRPKSKVVVTTFYALGQLKEHMKCMGPRLVVYKDLGRDQLFRIQAAAHVSVCMIDKGNSAGTYLEQVLAGQVVCFVDRAWSRSVFKGVDFPFFFTTTEQAVALLRWIHDNYEEAVAKMQPIKEYIIQELGSVNASKRLEALFESTLTPKLLYAEGMPKESEYEAVFRLMPAEFSLDRFCDAMMKRDDIFKLGLATGEKALMKNPVHGAWIPFGRRALLKWLRTKADDTNKSSVAIFRKK